MASIDRLMAHYNDSLDDVLSHIKYGRIKCGKYAHLIKIDKKLKLKREVIIDGENRHQKKSKQ